MKKIFMSLLLVASLFFITACNTDDTGNGNDTNGGDGTTTAPVTENNDDNSPVKLSNFRVITENYRLSEESIYVSVDVEVNHDGLAPLYDLSIKDANGEALVELTANDDNPDLASCDLSLTNANVSAENQINCNSLFEVTASGEYTLDVTDETGEVVRSVVFQLDLQDKKITLSE